MAKVIVATMSEWHQVQRKYALEIDVAYLKDLFPNESDPTNFPNKIVFNLVPNVSRFHQVNIFFKSVNI